VIGLMLPGGKWREAVIVLKSHVDATTGKTVVDSGIGYGQLIGALVDFIIIAAVVFIIARGFLPKKDQAEPQAKACPQGREVIPVAATRCKACTQPVPA